MPSLVSMDFDAATTAVLMIDIQTDYQDVQNFAAFRRNVQKCRRWVQRTYPTMKTCHVFEVDNENSHWLAVWEELHGRPRPLDAGIPFPFSRPRSGEATFYKNGYDAFFETTLHEYLQQHNIHTLVVCGLLTGVCVLNSVFSAFNRGYRVILVGNCCSDRTKTRHDHTLRQYKNALFRVADI
jgi:isochorismate hydrolase